MDQQVLLSSFSFVHSDSLFTRVPYNRYHNIDPHVNNQSAELTHIHMQFNYNFAFGGWCVGASCAVRSLRRDLISTHRHMSVMSQSDLTWASTKGWYSHAQCDHALAGSHWAPSCARYAIPLVLVPSSLISFLNATSSVARCCIQAMEAASPSRRVVGMPLARPAALDH